MNALFVGHDTTRNQVSGKECLINEAFHIPPAPAMRDCCECGRKFFSRSSANVVCVICKVTSTATFERGM